MPSFVWFRDPAEAHANPYEHPAQAQFAREAKVVLDKLADLLNRYTMRFHRDDKSSEKAIWFLQTDAVDALRDALDMIGAKKHRISGRLFRDVLETLNLAAYFHSDSDDARADLRRWYEDDVIPHKRYREFIANTVGPAAKEESVRMHRNFSKFTHRTYRALSQSYSLGGGDLLVYEGFTKTDLLVLPSTIAEHYAGLASFIWLALEELPRRGLVSEEEVKEALASTFEAEVVPRRFVRHCPLPE